MRMADRAKTVVVAVHSDAVRELEHEGLAFPVPVLRGPVLDAVVTIGMDSTSLVTLLQAPDSIRAFAAWVRDRCARSGDSIELNAKRGRRQVHLTVRGDVDINVVADFLVSAFADHDSRHKPRLGHDTKNKTANPSQSTPSVRGCDAEMCSVSPHGSSCMNGM
jgi:hypothetical protein